MKYSIAYTFTGTILVEGENKEDALSNYNEMDLHDVLDRTTNFQECVNSIKSEDKDE